MGKFPKEKKSVWSLGAEGRVIERLAAVKASPASLKSKNFEFLQAWLLYMIIVYLYVQLNILYYTDPTLLSQGMQIIPGNSMLIWVFYGCGYEF